MPMDVATQIFPDPLTLLVSPHGVFDAFADDRQVERSKGRAAEAALERLGRFTPVNDRGSIADRAYWSQVWTTLRLVRSTTTGRSLMMP
jgi:hypothetical protein